VTATFRQEIDLLLSRRVDTRALRTVCVALGPYRNLTTITAAILALHPHCQVLNHAGRRVLNHPRLDFLRYHERGALDAFARYAIHISRGGRRGDYGGSITLSHAFADNPALTAKYRAAYTSTVKDVIHSLFWKESLAVANHIRDHAVDLGLLLREEPRLRFLMPIRNPLDCAVSNLRTKHAARLRGLDVLATVEQVILAILGEIHWFLELRSRHPDRFYCFFAHEFGPQTLSDMARLLDIEVDEHWHEDALDVFRDRAGYDHGAKLRTFYVSAVHEWFSDDPAIAARLVQFVDAPGAKPRVPDLNDG